VIFEPMVQDILDIMNHFEGEINWVMSSHLS
jgi:hypothetical protein